MANPHGTSILGVSGTVSAAAVEQLAATKPWVRFISVLTFIGAGFMLIAAVGMVMMGMMGGSGKIPGNPANHLFSGAMGFGLAALYALWSIIYIFPGVKLWKYADSIAQLINSGRNDDLVAALNQQRSFWMSDLPLVLGGGGGLVWTCRITL